MAQRGAGPAFRRRYPAVADPQPSRTTANGGWRQLSAGRIPSLDGLRALSIASVVGYHWLDATVRARTHHDYDGPWKAIFSGELGVSVFFVISGFLITHLLLRERERSGTINLPAFYLRRSFRIWPAFFFYLVVLLGLRETGRIWFHIRDWVTAATFTFNYLSPRGSWWVGHSWSLSVEEQFYLLWPLAVLLLSCRAAGHAAIALLAVVPMVRLAEVAWLPGDNVLVEGISKMTHNRLDTLMFGCCVALLYERPRFQRFVDGCDRWGATLLAAAYLPASFWIESRVPNPWRLAFGYTAQGACITLVLLWVVRHADRPLGRALNWRPLVHLGHISFSLYLWQQLFFVSLNHSWTGRFPFNLLMAIAMAELSFHAIERPFLALRDRVMNRRRAVDSGSQSAPTDHAVQAA
jgi:peptidoglycan/LPS O-acetylase OafA/YrhL